MKIIRSFLQTNAVLILLGIGILAISGAVPDWSKIPDPRPRVLSLTTNVPEGFVKVVDVIDGDTIVVLADGKEETVRLIGVDTPETRDPRKAVQCFGKEASHFTRDLLAGRAVRLVPDSTQSDRDKYGRLLRYVYLEDGSTVNDRLIYEGYGFAYEAYPNARLERFKEIEQDAKKNVRGLWSGCTISIEKNGKQKKTQDAL